MLAKDGSCDETRNAQFGPMSIQILVQSNEHKAMSNSDILPSSFCLTASRFGLITFIWMKSGHLDFSVVFKLLSTADIKSVSACLLIKGNKTRMKSKLEESQAEAKWSFNEASRRCAIRLLSKITITLESIKKILHNSSIWMPNVQ